jgi:hypothetical protein
MHGTLAIKSFYFVLGTRKKHVGSSIVRRDAGQKAP